MDPIRSPLRQSITEHFLSLDSTLNSNLTSGFCILPSNQGVIIKPILCVCVWEGVQGECLGLTLSKGRLRSFLVKGSVDKWWLGEENWLFNEQSSV